MKRKINKLFDQSSEDWTIHSIFSPSFDLNSNLTRFWLDFYPNGSDEMLRFITDREEDNDSPEDMVLEIDSDEDEANGILVGRNLQGTNYLRSYSSGPDKHIYKKNPAHMRFFT